VEFAQASDHRGDGLVVVIGELEFDRFVRGPDLEPLTVLAEEARVLEFFGKSDVPLEALLLLRREGRESETKLKVGRGRVAHGVLMVVPPESPDDARRLASSWPNVGNGACGGMGVSVLASGRFAGRSYSSRHLPTLAAQPLAQSGGLEVPS
jgi:hypothetical protein